MRQARICLIVDNPLRDLDGLVLLAWQLAQQGATAYLVPMYDQGFDVPALAPDLVLANYARPNNADLLKSYKQAGILVGILDTEGIGGKNSDHFAELVANSRCGEYVDLYCVWGNAQYGAFLKRGIVPDRNLRATGCPRYDFCAEPWRGSLPKPGNAFDYILVNTNFPTVNPRFSRGQRDEIKTMVSVGFEESFARQFISDGKRAHEAMIETCSRLAQRYHDISFVLRPHPFENTAAYAELSRKANVQVRQEGTSLEWIAACQLLLHQNCSTAIEATMLGKEPLALEWFNTSVLRLPASCGVSRSATSYDNLVHQIDEVMRARAEPVCDETQKFRKDIISDLYLANDGRSCRRVADAILDAVIEKRAPSWKRHPSPSIRGTTAQAARVALGYKWSGALRRLYASPVLAQRRAAKNFSVGNVVDVLRRLEIVSRGSKGVVATAARAESRLSARQMSGATVELVLAS